MSLTDLNDLVLVRIMRHGLAAKDLARLEATAPLFAKKDCALVTIAGEPGQFSTASDAAAQDIVRARRDGRRVEPRSSESWKYALFVLECRLCPPRTISFEGSHTLAIADGTLSPEISSNVVLGTLCTGGTNNYSQLGIGDSTDMAMVTQPPHDKHEEFPLRQLAQPTDVLSVAVSSRHSACVTVAGALYTWGCASGGKLGHDAVIPQTPTWSNPGSYNALVMPVVAAPRLVTGFPANIRVAVVSVSGAEARAFGGGGPSEGHTACVTATGELFTFGKNSHGQLGHGNKEDQGTPRRVEGLQERITMVACSTGGRDSRIGGGSTTIVTASGSVFMCGNVLSTCDNTLDASDYRGNDDDPEWPQALVPKRVPFPDGVQIQSVAGTADVFAAISTDGSLFTWGEGRAHWDEVEGAALHYAAYGEQGVYPTVGVLGHPEISTDNWRQHTAEGFEALPRKVQNLPAVGIVSTSGFHMAAITVAGELWTWGDGIAAGGNGLCMYNDPGRWAPSQHPTKVLNATGVRAVFCYAKDRIAKHHSMRTLLFLANGETRTFGSTDGTHEHGIVKPILHRMQAPKGPHDQ
jgi:alpha-tubulin suppressor-like RCC1 family protein